jgi:lambda repressor-like predicted transcriptional regulator
MFISDLLKDRNKFEEFLLNIIIKYGRKYKKIDELIKLSNKASTVYSYIINVSKKPFPEKEWLIAQDEAYSYHYAKNILNGRFEKGEDAISKSKYYAFHYAKDVLKSRFKKGEETIIKDRYYLKEYVKFLKQIGKLDEFLKDHPEVKL